MLCRSIKLCVKISNFGYDIIYLQRKYFGNNWYEEHVCKFKMSQIYGFTL